MKKPKKQESSSLFDRHHQIHRFTILFVLASGTLLAGWTQSHLHHNAVVHQQLITVDSAGSTATFSISTNTQITLGSTYLSNDQKTAFVPLTFNTMNNVGITANGYKIYMADTSGKPMEYQVLGRLYLYGTSGKGVIVLHAPKRILNEPLQVFLLNKKHVSALNINNADEAFDKNESDTSDPDNNFGRFDVAPFRINPASYDIQRNTRMPNFKTDPTLKQVYENTFTSQQISQAQNSIDAKKQQIKQYQVVSNNLIQRLTQQGYKVPGEPVWMEDNWRPFDAIDLKRNVTSNGKSLSKFNPTKDTDKDLNAVTFKDSLESRNGRPMGSAKAAQDSNGDQDGGDTTSTESPALEWANLQTVWQKVESVKRDIYVNIPYQMYQYQKDENQYVSQGSIGDINNFRQVSH